MSPTSSPSARYFGQFLREQNDSRNGGRGDGRGGGISSIGTSLTTRRTARSPAKSQTDTGLLSWDGESRLTKVALHTGIRNTFAYNGDGQRVQKQDSTGTTKHVWDQQNIVLETDGSGTVAVVYTRTPLLPGGPISPDPERYSQLLPHGRLELDHAIDQHPGIRY